MPLVPSHDPGNRNGMVHSHRFPAANTAVASVNNDAAAIASGGAVPAIRIHHRGSVRRQPRGRGEGRHRDAPPGFRCAGYRIHVCGGRGSRAVGAGRAARSRESWRRRSGRPAYASQPGTTVRVDAVVRTRKIGHFFPGGHGGCLRRLAGVQGVRCNRAAFWPGAGAWKTRAAARWNQARTSIVPIKSMAQGNPINKRNAWQTRSVLYVRLIPPGAADTVHFRLPIPRDVDRSHHAGDEAQLSQVCRYLHEVRIRRRGQARARRSGVR